MLHKSSSQQAQWQGEPPSLVTDTASCAADVAEHTEEASAQQQPEEATTQQAAADEAEATPAASPVQAAEEATDATLAETTETTEESTQTAAAPSQEESAAPAAGWHSPLIFNLFPSYSPLAFVSFYPLHVLSTPYLPSPAPHQHL